MLGGLIGSNVGEILQSRATIAVTGSGGQDSSDLVGGIVGENRGTVEESYASGAVTNGIEDGGLVGENQGTVTNSYATGAVSGSGDNGGIVGVDIGSMIKDTYATGTVSSGEQTGGLVGDLSGDYSGTSTTTLENSYFETDSNSSLNAVGVSTGPTATVVVSADSGESTAALQTPPSGSSSVFGAWSTSDWTFSPGEYPKLTWQVVSSNVQTPTITAEPVASQTVNLNQSSVSLSVTASVSDGGAVSYQWYRNTTNSATGGTKISGAKNSTYDVPTTGAGTMYYYCIVTNTNSGVSGSTSATATSSVAKVAVVVTPSNPPTIAVNPAVVSTGGSTVHISGDTGASQPVKLFSTAGSWTGNGQSTTSTVYSVYADMQGKYSANWMAPTAPGTYGLVATSDGTTVSVPVVVEHHLGASVPVKDISTSPTAPLSTQFSINNPGGTTSSVGLNIPAHTFSSSNTILITSTSNVSDITPQGTNVIVNVGVNFTGTPQHPITLTIQSPTIESSDVIYKVLSNGTYQKMPDSAVSITSGKAVIAFTNDPNFIVTAASGNGGSTGSTGGGPALPAILTDSFTESAQVGQSYSAHIVEIAGTDPMKWTVDKGSLPPGLSLDDQGNIAGTPTSAGTYTFTVTVTDANSLSSSKKLTLTVNGTSSSTSSGDRQGDTGGSADGTSGQQTAPSEPLTPAIATNQTATIGKSYQLSLRANGGESPFTWSISSGTLSQGLTLDQKTGVIFGVPKQSEMDDVTVTVTDAGESKARQVVKFDVLLPYEREVLWNGTVKNIPAIVAKDGSTKTTYMPIWYVMQLLKRVGLQNHWNGTTWSVTKQNS